MTDARAGWRAVLCALGLVAMLAGAAAADVVVSTRNDPQTALSREDRLALILGPDRPELRPVRGAGIARAWPAPEPAPSAVRRLTGTRLARLMGRQRPEIRPKRGASLAAVLRPARPRPPVRAGTGLRYTAAYLAGLPEASGGPEWRCLAEALYFEARGESVRGIFAVAEVVLNRVDSRSFPGSVCAVVHQGTGKRFQCQFTWTCDGRADRIREPAAWAKVGKVARLMLDGAPRSLTGGATHYHSNAVMPRWARRFAHTVTIGAHRFYRMG